MGNQTISEAGFIDAWKRLGSARLVAEELGTSERQVHARRKMMVDKGHNLMTRASPGYESRSPYQDEAGWTFPRQVNLDIDTGVVIVSSDHHYWPGEPSVAHRALIAVTKKVKPRVQIVNGDVMDGAKTGRHDPFGWSNRPSVVDELNVCQERLGEIVLASPRGCKRLWSIGNHDVRFERNLCAKASDYVNVHGMRLADHFPDWDMAWSYMINPESAHPVMVKHRYASGIHAGYNATLKGGLSIVTGHTHILEVKPWGDYRGRRWGVQTGTLADHHGPQFEYTENSPSPACSGFAVLTFKDGQLLPPELCEVINGVAWFRGEPVA